MWCLVFRWIQGYIFCLTAEDFEMSQHLPAETCLHPKAGDGELGGKNVSKTCHVYFRCKAFGMGQLDHGLTRIRFDMKTENPCKSRVKKENQLISN